MAGTFSVSKYKLYDRENIPRGSRLVVVATADGSGAFGSQTIAHMNGGLGMIGVIPGSTAPTTAMDAYLYHPQAATLDVLGGALANIDTSATKNVKPLVNGSASGVGLSGDYVLTLSGNVVASASITFIFDLFDL